MAESLGSLTKNVSGDCDQRASCNCKKGNATHYCKQCDKHLCAQCFASDNKLEGFCDHHSAFPLQPSVTPEECPDGPVPVPVPITFYITHPDNDQPIECSKVEMSLIQSGQYKIVFTPIIRGSHQLHLKVHDIDIPGSPFSIPLSEKEVNLHENPNSVKKDKLILPPASACRIVSPTARTSNKKRHHQRCNSFPNCTDSEILNNSPLRSEKKSNRIFFPRGLYNLGNTCYMNSALQCLTHTSPLRKYFLETRDSTPWQRKVSPVYTDFLDDIVCNSNKDVIDPTNLKRVIAQIAPRFGGRSQEDAQELLTFLLDGLHEDENSIREKPYIKMAVDEEEKTHKEIAKEWWDKHLLRNNSKIVNIFHGQVRVQITCSEGHVTQMFEPISQLTLPIPQTSKVIQSTPDYEYGNNIHTTQVNSEYPTLHHCLELYTQEKQTSSFCEKCNDMIASSRKVQIWKMSQIVIVHLKRFIACKFGHQKVDTMVEFPKRLSFENFTENPEEKNDVYDLYAVINHIGELYRGHYFAFVKHDNSWYCCDDAHIEEISEDFVVTNNAYVLFFQKWEQH